MSSNKGIIPLWVATMGSVNELVFFTTLTFLILCWRRQRVRNLKWLVHLSYFYIHSGQGLKQAAPGPLCCTVCCVCFLLEWHWPLPQGMIDICELDRWADVPSRDTIYAHREASRCRGQPVCESGRDLLRTGPGFIGEAQWAVDERCLVLMAGIVVCRVCGFQPGLMCRRHLHFSNLKREH